MTDTKTNTDTTGAERTAHSPLPWRLEETRGFVDIVDSDGELVLEVEPNNPFCEGNAELSLRAVNCHEELVEALERVLGIRNPNVPWTKAETERSWNAWEEQARAALAKAKGAQ